MRVDAGLERENIYVQEKEIELHHVYKLKVLHQEVDSCGDFRSRQEPCGVRRKVDGGFEPSNFHDVEDRDEISDCFCDARHVDACGISDEALSRRQRVVCQEHKGIELCHGEEHAQEADVVQPPSECKLVLGPGKLNCH